MSRGVAAEIKAIIYDWWHGETEPPQGATDFAGTVQIMIGAAGGKAADSFDLLVCSPSQFAVRYHPDRWDDEEVLPGGNVLPVTGVWLMKAWSRAEFEGAVNRHISACSPGPNFETVAERIGRLIPWERDYQHDRDVNHDAGLPHPAESLWHDD